MKQKTFATDHWEVATTKNLLGACLTDEGKCAAAWRAELPKPAGPESVK